MNKWLHWIGAALVAVIALSACSTATRPDTAAAPSSARANRSLVSDFQITAYQGEQVLGGKEIKFSKLLAQGKPVILNFWAGLCPPCRAEMPDFQATYAKYQDKVIFLGLDVGPFVGLGSRDDGKALLKELGVKYPVGTTFDQQVVRAYQIQGMPTTYFITPRGEVFQKWTGLLTKDKLAELIEATLAAQ